VVQLRQDNKLGTLWNMVGFQTKLKHGEQTRIFRSIPGLEKAEFARLGGLHRNTFINSPRLLDGELRLKSQPHIRFAGQVTGVEGYVESAAIGLLAGRFAAAEALGRPVAAPPPTTAFGALLVHITGGADEKTFQPMNVNFGLFPPLAAARKIKGKDRKQAMSERALADLTVWLGEKQAAGNSEGGPPRPKAFSSLPRPAAPFAAPGAIKQSTVTTSVRGAAAPIERQ
jgi:methylenetetrahydrofolate--tRNA-(uracil-5-)-methyltransferase